MSKSDSKSVKFLPSEMAVYFYSSTHGLPFTLQKLWFNLGPDGVDGRWGPNTSSAVGKFQTYDGLNSTGELDERTFIELMTMANSTPFVKNYYKIYVGEFSGFVQYTQKNLNTLADSGKISIYAGFPDGVWAWHNSQTADSVRDYQESKGYTVTGAIDTNTYYNLIVDRMLITDPQPEAPNIPSTDWTGNPMSGEEYEGLLQNIIDYGKELASNRQYVYDPRNWQDELQNNINPLIDIIPSNLSDEQRTSIVDAIIIVEAQKLQAKYRTVYTASDNVINKYITERGFHKGLEPLYEQYPQVDKNTNPLIKAFFAGLTAGFNVGIWYSASSPASKGTHNSWKNADLLDDLASSGVKYNANDVLAVTKTGNGKLVWLESGNSKAGMQHILDHADDFAKKGIQQNQIKDLVMESLTNGKVVGYQGRGTGRPIYEVTFGGKHIKQQ